MPSLSSIALNFLSWFCHAGLVVPRKSLRPKDVLKSPASGVVLRRDACLGQGVEQGGFAYVWKADDTALERHEISFGINPSRTIEPDVSVVEVHDPRYCPPFRNF